MLEKLITAIFLMLPGLAWGPAVQIAEPGALPLIAVAGVIATAVKYMNRKK